MGSPGLLISSLQKTTQKNSCGQDFVECALVLGYDYFFPADILTQSKGGTA